MKQTERRALWRGESKKRRDEESKRKRWGDTQHESKKERKRKKEDERGRYTKWRKEGRQVWGGIKLEEKVDAHALFHCIIHQYWRSDAEERSRKTRMAGREKDWERMSADTEMRRRRRQMKEEKYNPEKSHFLFFSFFFFFKMRECVPAKFKVLKCNWSCILTESVRHLWRGHWASVQSLSRCMRYNNLWGADTWMCKSFGVWRIKGCEEAKNVRYKSLK